VNHLIASAGEAISCESTPAAVYEVLPEDGLLAHSNHFLSARAREAVHDTGIAAHPDTIDRAPRIEQLLTAQRPVEPADLRAAFCDHDGYPDSICRHAETIEPGTWTTVASVVMDLDELRVWLAAGPPCGARYRGPATGRLSPARRPIARSSPDALDRARPVWEPAPSR
jgi:isopenicillin-N N-acyltransferase-like protein